MAGSARGSNPNQKKIFGMDNVNYQGPKKAHQDSPNFSVKDDFGDFDDDLGFDEYDDYDDYDSDDYEYAEKEFYEGEGHEYMRQLVQDRVEEDGYSFGETSFEQFWNDYDSETYRLQFYDGNGSYEMFWVEDGDMMMSEDNIRTWFDKDGGEDIVDGYLEYTHQR